mmetsp:Transcript_7715/g.12483  ORF Transcript_7715/g.12483 Transcript_7715/m.12483 type:complete len:299 (-) Transcript_7715:1078-1974(-)
MTLFRLTKRIAETRFCSRREAERLVSLGMVKVNGSSENVHKGTHIGVDDEVRIYGNKLTFPEPGKKRNTLYMAYKLRGELVTYSDPRGRPTIFQRLEAMGLPKNLIAVGRLDYQSEGLLLLTLDGAYARELELPENDYLRRYKARVSSGTFTEHMKNQLMRGVQLAPGEPVCRPIIANLLYSDNLASARKSRNGKRRLKDKESKQMVENYKRNKANVNHWLDVRVTEGKYREVRRALGSVGCYVDHLVRTQFGPYELGKLPKGAVRLIRKRVYVSENVPEVEGDKASEVEEESKEELD